MSLSLPSLGRLQLLTITLARVDARHTARLLELGVVAAMVGLAIWAVGPGNLLENLIGTAGRQASVFISLLGAGIGLALLASAIALMRGKPAWSLAIAALPLLALFAMLVR